MKILVTGGAGFIGSAVVRHVIENTEDSIGASKIKVNWAGNKKKPLKPASEKPSGGTWTTRTGATAFRTGRTSGNAWVESLTRAFEYVQI